MSRTSTLYGCIFGAPGARRDEHRFQCILRSNAETIGTLPTKDEYPPLARNLFRVSAQAHHEPGFFKVQMISFAASVKQVESAWDVWLEKFEALLAKLCWSRVHLHLELEGPPEGFSHALYSYRWQANSRALQRALEQHPHAVSGWSFDGGPRHFKSASEMARWETYHRRQMRTAPREDVFISLARTLAQQGRAREALELLTPSTCSFAQSAEIHRAWKMILQGRWGP